jgi:hypothetical protein
MVQGNRVEIPASVSNFAHMVKCLGNSLKGVIQRINREFEFDFCRSCQ